MKLLFCPERPDIRWCRASKGSFPENAASYSPGFRETVLEDLRGTGPEAVGYMLFHGGEGIRKTVNLVTGDILAEVERSERYLPEDNAITARLLKIFMKIYPDVPHYLFCDTGFFAKLPEEANTYAVPYEFTRQGVRKYGSNGLCHDWVSGKIKTMPGYRDLRKIVSIFVGNRTNVTAIDNGVPVETSAGFTPVEGIPSLNGCGDIDPTIIFELHSAGLGFGDINRILTSESGFRGLLGVKCAIEDIIDPAGPEGMDGARDIYYYNVIKHAGYSMALLGGADAVVVSCENAATAAVFAETLCRKMEYPVLKTVKGRGTKDGIEDITGKGSELKIFIAVYDRWKIMDEKMDVP